MNNMIEITRCQEIDQGYFWYIVNRKNRSKNKCNVHPIKASNNKVLTDTADIKKEWKAFFETL